ncbi:MAG: citrate lyase subunit alpha [Enterobacteriaceae bacterium]
MARRSRWRKIRTTLKSRPAFTPATAARLPRPRRYRHLKRWKLVLTSTPLTGSDGVMRGASGGHCDVAAAAI